MRLRLFLAVVLLGAGLTGCIGDTGDEAVGPSSDEADADETWGEPIPETVAGVEHLGELTVESGALNGGGIWTHGDHAYVSGLGSGFHVVDISDPKNPVRVGNISGEEVYSRDVDLLETDNRTIAVLATQSGGMTFVDVTDPTAPRILSILEIEPNHNVAVVPNTTLVYNSPSTGEGRANEIVDASDPLRPEVVAEFGEHGCHDITFYTSPSGDTQRAYCAGVDVTEIWDISDPMSPELVTTVSNPCMDDDVTAAPYSNCGGLHHTAFVNHDASVLIVGDEFQGGAGPGCGAQQSAAGMSAATPIGALWFYDISAEENPALLGWFAPDVPAQRHADALTGTLASSPTAAPFSMSCTSHFGDLMPGKEMAVIGWYHAGVVLIDFSDPENPMQVDQWADQAYVWDAKVHNGYVFTGDIQRGLDSLRLMPGGG